MGKAFQKQRTVLLEVIREGEKIGGRSIVSGWASSVSRSNESLRAGSGGRAGGADDSNPSAPREGIVSGYGQGI